MTQVALDGPGELSKVRPIEGNSVKVNVSQVVGNKRESLGVQQFKSPRLDGGKRTIVGDALIHKEAQHFAGCG